jgi:hypothetical protein
MPAKPAAAAGAPTVTAPRPAGRLSSGADRLLSPFALALTIVLAPLGIFTGPRTRR